MRTTRQFWFLVAILADLIASGPAVARGGDGDLTLGAEERQQIELDLRELTGRLGTLRGAEGRGSESRRDRLADAEVFAKGIAWALRFDTTFTPADLKLRKTAIERCRDRVAALEAGEAPWAARKGKVVRGFVSGVDGSVQPYAVVVPAKYDRSRATRLDVVLHGAAARRG